MRRFILTVALVVLSLPAAARDEKKLYKWEDADGKVFYSDKIPPEYAERPKERLNEHGVAIESLEGKKTEEQRAQEERDEKLRLEMELQRRADTALLATYQTVAEIEMHRDRRVELFRAQAKVTVLYLKNLARRLENIRQEASHYQPYSEDPDAPMIPEDLARELRKTKETIERHERNLKKYETDEAEIMRRFDGDIQRFKNLTGITATASVSP